MSYTFSAEERRGFMHEIGDLMVDCAASEERLAIGVGTATEGEEIAYLLSTLTKAVLLLVRVQVQA